MEGATIDVRLVITLAGSFVSVVSAAAIAWQQIKQIEVTVNDFEQRLRELDRRVDRSESGIGVHEQRVQVLSGMMSPETQERKAREVADLQARITVNERAIQALQRLHNGSHPQVPHK